MVVPSNIDKARALLKEAGYDNTPLLMLHATDVASLSPQPVVMAPGAAPGRLQRHPGGHGLAERGLRRASRALPADGGWSILNTNMYTADLAGSGAHAHGRGRWRQGLVRLARLSPDRGPARPVRAKLDAAEQKRIAAELQRVAIDEGLYVPLGKARRSGRIQASFPDCRWRPLRYSE